MIGRIVRGLRREDDGFAIIVGVVLLAALATLSALMVTMGTHAERSSGRGRSWSQALHVAEAGVQSAIARLDDTNGSFSGSLTGQAADGSYCVTVTKLARNRYTIEASGVAPPDTSGNCAPSGAGLGAKRRLKVTMAPPHSFQFALFSQTSVDTKNNDHVIGDIWANQNIVIDNNDIVEGDLYAATGWIQLKQGSRVTGTATSGGFDPSNQDRSIHVESNALIEGDAIAASSQAPSQANCRADHINWKVRLEGPAQNVGGNLRTCGPKTGPGTVGGTIEQGVYIAAPPTKPLPTFTFNAANYGSVTYYGTPSAPSATAVSDFNSWLANGGKNSLSGVFYINQSGTVNQDVRIDLTGAVVSGDLTVIANVPIFTNGMSDASSVTDAIVVLASTYKPATGSTCDVNHDQSDCTIHIKNNFQVSTNPPHTCNTAVLLYSPYGPVAVKNNQEMCGSIYAENIQIKNNQTIAYDERVDQIIGFGEVTLEVDNWVELAPS